VSEQLKITYYDEKTRNTKHSTYKSRNMETLLSSAWKSLQN